MRAETRDFVGENLSTDHELAPFSLPTKDGRHSTEIRPHLWMKIEDMLAFNDGNSRRYNY